MAKAADEIEGFDRVFPLIGGHHFFQWLLMSIVTLQGVLAAFHHIGYVFLGAVPDYWCENELLERATNWTEVQIKNISIPRKIGDMNGYENCEQYDLDYRGLIYEGSYEDAYASVNFAEAPRIRCSKWKFDKSIYSSTTVTEFNLICGRDYMVATIQAAYMVGAFFGSFAIGGLSDTILGRRRATLLSVALIILGGYGAGFSTSYFAFVICRFFIAMGVTGCIQNCFTLVMEYSDISCRASMGMIQSVPFGFGCVIMPIYAYFFRDWSNLQLAYTSSCLILLSYFWILPESSRWLISNGRDEEAMKVLAGIAKRNKKPEPNRVEMLEILQACKDENKQTSGSNGQVNNREKVSHFKRSLLNVKNFFKNYLRLVKTPELRKRTLIISTLFMSVAFVYYGIIFGSAKLTNNPFLLVSLGGVVEIIGIVLATPFVAKWGRAPTVASTFLLSGGCTIAVAVTPLDFTVTRVVLANAGKLFISGTYAVIYVLATELYPTETRATGLGLASLMGRIGSMCAPFVVNQLRLVYTELPSMIFGAVGIFAGLIALLLPETKDEELRESVKAIEIVGKVAALRRSSRASQRSLPRKSSVGLSGVNEATC